MNVYEEVEKLPFFKEFNKEKFELQKKLYEEWKQGDNSRGIRMANSTIAAATGFGKTTCGLLASLENGLKNRTTLFVVPSVNLKQQTKKHIEAWGIKNTTVQTLQKIIRDKKKLKYDLLIIDEIHNAKAPEFRKVFDYVQRRYLMGLTATFPDDERAIVLLKNCPVIAEVTLEEAIDRSFVTDFKIHVVDVPMEGKTYTKFKKTNRDWESAKNFFLGNHNTIFAISREMSSLKKKGIPAKEGPLIKKWKKYKNLDDHGPIIFFAMKGMMKINERVNLIYTEPAKTDLTKKLCDSLSKKGKVIIFCKRKNTANELHLKSDSYLITGDTANKKRLSILDEFAKDGHNLLYTADALNEGVDVKNIDYAVIHSFNSSVKESRQRIGRAIRVSKRKKIAHIFILRCKVPSDDSPDYWWLKNIIEGIENKVSYYNIDNFKQIWIDGEQNSKTL